MATLKTFLSGCFLSDCPQSEEYSYRFYPLCAPKIKVSQVHMLKEAAILCLFFLPKTLSKRRAEMSAIWAEEQHMFSHSRRGVQKAMSECNTLCEFMISDVKRTQQSITDALKTHHVLISCNGTSWINMGVSADQHQVFWQFIDVSNETKPCRVYLSIMHHIKVPVHNIPSCFMTCFVEYMKPSCLIRTQIQQFRSVSCWWRRHTSLLCKKGK